MGDYQIPDFVACEVCRIRRLARVLELVKVVLHRRVWQSWRCKEDVVLPNHARIGLQNAWL